MNVRTRLAALHCRMPPIAPVHEFVAVSKVGNLAFVSGHAPFFADEFQYKGKVGLDLDLTTAQCAAEWAVLGCLSSLEHALGSLDRIRQIIKVNGYVNCTANFQELPLVTDAASRLLIALFGDNGQHARTTVGVSSLPSGVAVEIEMIVQHTA